MEFGKPLSLFADGSAGFSPLDQHNFVQRDDLQGAGIASFTPNPLVLSPVSADFESQANGFLAQSELGTESNYSGSGSSSNSAFEANLIPSQVDTSSNALLQGLVPEVKGNAAKPKRRKVIMACFHCRRSHTSCDSHRPCRRCASKNLKCFDAPRKPQATHGLSGPVLPFLDHSKSTELVQPVPFHQALVDNEKMAIVYMQSLLSPNSAAVSPHSTPPLTPAAIGDPQQVSEMCNYKQYIQNAVPPQPIAVFPTSALGDEFASLNSGFRRTHSGAPVPEKALIDPFDTLCDMMGNMNSKNGSSCGGYRSLLDPATNTESSELHRLFGDSFVPPCLDASNGNKESPCDSCPIKNAQKLDAFYVVASGKNQSHKSMVEQFRSILIAKYKAGLLTPFPYEKDTLEDIGELINSLSPHSRTRILENLRKLRNKNKEWCSQLSQFDLIVQEEYFTRLSLECNRMWALLGTPSAVWRRDGTFELCSASFCDLTGISRKWIQGRQAVQSFLGKPVDTKTEPEYKDVPEIEKLPEKLESKFHKKYAKCMSKQPVRLKYPLDEPRYIFEFFTESSLVNYTERVTQAITTPSQRAIIMMVNMLVAKNANSSKLFGDDMELSYLKSNSSLTNSDQPRVIRVSACFTLRRDKNGIPLAIVGSFLPV